MGTILEFRPRERQEPRPPREPAMTGEVVIYPGVRIERHEVDLSHRLRDTAGTGEFDDFGGNGRPRKTS